jgi:hypothetical protein
MICNLRKNADNGTCGTVEFTDTSCNRNAGDGMFSPTGHISKCISVYDNTDIGTTVGATINERVGLVGNGVVELVLDICTLQK